MQVLPTNDRSNRILQFGAVLLIALLSGCDASRTTAGHSDRDAGHARLQTTFPAKGTSALLLQVQAEVPGFGGAFYDDSGTLNVYLSNSLDLPRAVAALNNAFGRDLAQPDVRRPDAQPSRAVAAQFDYGTLWRWRMQLRPRVLSLPGVSSLGIDERSNRVRISYDDPTAIDDVRSVIRAASIPESAVVLREQDVVRYLNHQVTDRVRPISGGLKMQNASMSPENFCTLGWVGNGFDYDPPLVAINSHCTEEYATVTGVTIYQNLIGDSNDIGDEVEDGSFFFSPDHGCPDRCRWADAALALSGTGVDLIEGTIARPTNYDRWNGSRTIWHENPRFTVIEELYYPLVGESVDKVGARTGWTFGPVSATCEDFPTQIPIPPGGTVHLLCQDQVSAGAGPGDSGSPVFLWTGDADNLAHPIGILWGGIAGEWYAYSPLENLTDDLGTEFWPW